MDLKNNAYCFSQSRYDYVSQVVFGGKRPTTEDLFNKLLEQYDEIKILTCQNNHLASLIEEIRQLKKED